MNDGNELLPKRKEGKTASLSLRLSPKIAKALSSLCEKERFSKSAVIERALEVYFEALAKGKS